MANTSQPSQQDTQQLIQQLNGGHLAAAEQMAKDLIAKHADTFILHHILALSLDGQQKFSESIASYENATKQCRLILQPWHRSQQCESI